MTEAVLTTSGAPGEAHRLASQTAARIAAVQRSLHDQGIDGLLIYAQGESDPAGSIRYLTGLMPNGEAACWIPASGDLIAISNDKNAARAWAQVLHAQARVIKTADLISTIDGVLSEVAPAGTLCAVAGLDQASRSRAAEISRTLAGRDAVDGGHIVTSLRARRTLEEEDRQRAATRIADAMVQRCMQVAAIPGATGLDLMAEVEFQGRRMGADKASCWLAIGERPAETYMLGLELATSITPQDRVQIGTTVMLDGYFSQVLRIGVFAEPSPRLREVSEAFSIAMQDEALAAMRPGNPVSDIGDALESAIDAFCPYTRADDPFRFQSCHAMGNSYSEPWSAPYLNANRDRSGDGNSPVIAPHQTYEIHPNFTLPDLGHVCAGDVGLVTPTGGEWMSRTPRGLFRIV